MEKWVALDIKDGVHGKEFYMIHLKNGSHRWFYWDSFGDIPSSRVINMTWNPFNDSEIILSSENKTIEDIKGAVDGENAYVYAELKGYGYKIIRTHKVEDRVAYGDIYEYSKKVHLMNVEVGIQDLTVKRGFPELAVIEEVELDQLIYRYQLKCGVVGNRDMLPIGIENGRAVLTHWVPTEVAMEKPSFVTGLGWGYYLGGEMSYNELISLLKRFEYVGEKSFYATYVGLSNFQHGKLVFPPGLKVIGKSAFERMRGLVEVELPYGLEEIGDRAFKGTEVTEIKIPKTVKKTGKYLIESVRRIRVDYEEERMWVELTELE